MSKIQGSEQCFLYAADLMLKVVFCGVMHAGLLNVLSIGIACKHIASC